jgi:AcrR family transcriptional regulator
MPYRRTEKVARRLSARRAAILDAARTIAAEEGMAAVQIVPVAERAGIAAGTVYRYFPTKSDLIGELARAISARELEAVGGAARAAPGPLSALSAAIVTFAMRALGNRRLAYAVMGGPVEDALDAVRLDYRQALRTEIANHIRAAIAAGHLPEQDPELGAAALVGSLVEGLLGPLAPAALDDLPAARAAVQMLALFALRGLGVLDARARGLIVQTALPGPERDDSAKPG